MGTNMNANVTNIAKDPQSLGDGEPSAEAAPTYPIRALVRADAEDYPANGLGCGQVIAVKRTRGGFYGWGRLEQGNMFFAPEELILDPTDEQIADERAKLGLPAETAPAAPKPSLGEGSPTVAELSEALRKYGCHVHAPGPMCERAKHSDYPCTCGLEAILSRVEAP